MLAIGISVSAKVRSQFIHFGNKSRPSVLRIADHKYPHMTKYTYTIPLMATDRENLGGDYKLD
jgi:hypothetical protein